MKRFGSEPNHNLLRCVQIAKLIESDSGIRREKIEYILQTGPSPTNEIALTLLQHLGWIQRQNKGYIWGEISNEDSKLLWLSDEINQDELSNVNLQFACWALLASLRSAEMIPLPQIISVLMEKNFWIVKQNDSRNKFFVKYNDKLASESSTIINLVQGSQSAPKMTQLLRNLNHLGLTRNPRRVDAIFNIHFEIPEKLAYFLLSNLIFKFNDNPKITEILEKFNDAFGIIDNTSQIPKVFSDCIFNLKRNHRIKFENPSGETRSIEIRDPFDHQKKERIMRLRKFDD